MTPQKTVHHTLRRYNRVVAKDNPVVDYKQVQYIVHSCQIQIGNKCILEYPMTSAGDAYYFQKKKKQVVVKLVY